MRLAPRAGSVLLASVATSLLLVAPGSAATHEVHAGESIQAAIDAADPGDTIKVDAGVFHENVTITKDGIMLRGAGSGDDGDDDDGGEDATVLMPAATPTETVCIDPSAPERISGVCVSGAVDPASGALGEPVHRVTVERLRIEGFSGEGFIGINAHGLTVEDSVAVDNGGYGISGFGLSDVTYEDNVADDNGEPGFYIGDSPEANAEVEGNAAHRNGVGGSEGFGIFIRDSSHGTLEDNVASGNCIGILLLNTGAPGPVSDWTVKDNEATANNGGCPGGGDEGGPPVSGIGIGLAGSHDVTVKHNDVTDNVATIESPLAGGIAIVDTTADGGAAPTDNTVKKNTILGNRPDIFWDGSGSGNVIKRNRCETSNPDGLCGDSHHRSHDD